MYSKISNPKTGHYFDTFLMMIFTPQYFEILNFHVLLFNKNHKNQPFPCCSAKHRAAHVKQPEAAYHRPKVKLSNDF